MPVSWLIFWSNVQIFGTIQPCAASVLVVFGTSEILQRLFLGISVTMKCDHNSSHKRCESNQLWFVFQGYLNERISEPFGNTYNSWCYSENMKPIDE